MNVRVAFYEPPTPCCEDPEGWLAFVTLKAITGLYVAAPTAQIVVFAEDPLCISLVEKMFAARPNILLNPVSTVRARSVVHALPGPGVKTLPGARDYHDIGYPEQTSRRSVWTEALKARFVDEDPFCSTLPTRPQHVRG